MRTLILLLAMLICAALPMAADARPRVVVDADMSFDDMLNGRAPQLPRSVRVMDRRSANR
jgi:hypothetical protein